MSDGPGPRGATRREVLATGAGALALIVTRPAQATPESMAAAIKAWVGEAEVRKGRVALDIPPLVENGNSVPLKVTVESPMTAEEFVRSIAIFNERNPQPNVAHFHLSPRAGRAEVSTRIRLGDSQNIVAIAQLSDGTFWSDTAELIVTLPACVET
ncbi:SoxY-related AACIE arm protein [Microvirga sp. GCM10011540]|uniref:SoxY-related AACIE arm protein n=1 Tax=Microvirga sp. GCM10011540 TaxID=3317338 RepID=UPI00361D92C5